MPRSYEAVYIFDAGLEDAAITEKLSRFHGLLNLAAEPELEHWGRRQLAYKIGTKESGYYVLARFDAETAGLSEYERALKLDDGIVRYLLSLNDRVLGAPPMTEEELAAQRRREEEDEDEE